MYIKEIEKQLEHYRGKLSEHSFRYDVYGEEKALDFEFADECLIKILKEMLTIRNEMKAFNKKSFNEENFKKYLELDSKCEKLENDFSSFEDTVYSGDDYEDY